MQVVNTIISIGVITVLFALMFKFLPDADIAWGDVWLGAFVTALLFSIGKTAIGIYLGNSGIASTFGAAGSLVLLLLWIYYSAQILFFGAEFTQVYANQYGSKIVPEGAQAAPSTRTKESKKEIKDVQGQPVLPAPAYVDARERQLEKENTQTARFVFGLMIASFFTGIMTTILGIKRR
jgi:uncharacterized BrkB/YihY/UPF0761 family membrane protein